MNGRLKLKAFGLIGVLSLTILGVCVAESENANTGKETERAVTAIKEVHRGQHVVLEGTVKRVTDSDEFVLEDESGRIKIYIGWKNRMPVAAGETVKVWGVADDDAFLGFRPEIYAYTLELASGRKVDLTRGHD